MGGTGSFPSEGQATLGGVFRGVSELIMTLRSLSAIVWGCVPVLPSSALDPEGSCVGPGLVDMDTSGRSHAD